ncbi:hypothetical protein MMC30_003161 [Trapelia coarctata]|nr:hypothetical protein [Trapelia coarctata]
MYQNNTATPRTYVVPAVRTGSRRFSARSRGGNARHGPSNRSLPNQASAYSQNPGTEFTVNPPSRLRFELKEEDSDLDASQHKDKGDSKVSGAGLAENFQAMDLDEPPIPRPALSLNTSLLSEGLADKLQHMNLDGSYKPFCWSPESYTPSVGVPNYTSYPSTHSPDSTWSGGVRLGRSFIDSDYYDAAFSQAALSCGTPIAHPADGGFRYEHNVHPSATFQLPPTMLPFPSTNVSPFPSTVLPFPIGLSPLPLASSIEEPVFDSEDEARILKTTLRGIL